MTARDDFWLCVHAALDGRRDPVDDARVRAAIERDPSLADELARLDAGLADLARAPTRPRLAARLAAAAAVMIALPVVLFVTTRAESPKTPEPTQPVSTGRVLAWRVTVAIESPGSIRTRAVGDDGAIVATTAHTSSAPHNAQHPILAWEVTVR